MSHQSLASMGWTVAVPRLLLGATIIWFLARPDLGWLIAPPLLHVLWLAAAAATAVVMYRELGRPAEAAGPGREAREVAPSPRDPGTDRDDARLSPSPERAPSTRAPTAAVREGQGEIRIEWVRALDASLRVRITGQERAIQAVVDTFKLAVVGTAAKTRKPVASFLLAGPTGTGKTELAKITALALGRELVRLDMPNFSSREGAWRLTGSAGRPGSGDQGGGQLTTEVKRFPEAVVLLDEIEKADPVVWDPFLRVFDDGVLKDQALGQDVDFTRTVIFLTSNLLHDLPPETPEDELRRRLIETKYFRPELVNRIDRIILFAPLEPRALRTIIRKVVLKVVAKFQARQHLNHLIVQVDGSLVDLILSRCDSQFGARDAQRHTELLVGTAIAETFLGSEPAWRDTQSLWLGVENGTVVVKNE